MFAALDDEDYSALYYTYALIYALPYLGNGLQLDAWALLSVALCAVHVQARWARGWVGITRRCWFAPQLCTACAHGCWLPLLP